MECSLAILISPVGSLIDCAAFGTDMEGEGTARHKTRWR